MSRDYIAEALDEIRERAHRVAPDVAFNEAIDTMIDHMTAAEHLEVLDLFGNRDLSEPRPDLAEGWDRVRAQLAYNALAGAVREPHRHPRSRKP